MICPDGFIVEGPLAGGHTAPPRGQLQLDEHDEPVYGPRDEIDLSKIAALGLPFWVAGACGTPEQVTQAIAAGAVGVQVGTLFALSRESGLTEELRVQVLDRLRADELEVRTDALASPTGFPFKVAQLPLTLSDEPTYEERGRICDLGYLRSPFVTASGGIGYRCASEPLETYLRKGGELAETIGRKCLCNALTANVGLGQVRRGGLVESPMVTLGSDLDGAHALAAIHPDGWSAGDVVDWLLDA